MCTTVVSHRAKTTRHNSLLPQLWAKFSSPIICLCWPHSPDLPNSQCQEPRVQTGATPTHRGQTSDTEHGDRPTSLLRRSLHICLHLPTLPTSKKIEVKFHRRSRRGGLRTPFPARCQVLSSSCCSQS